MSVESTSSIKELNLSTIPGPLQTILLVLALLPIWSLVIHGAPPSLFQDEGLVPGMLVTLCYWIWPMLLITSIIIRHRLMTFFFLAEVVTLVIHAVFMSLSDNVSTDELFLRYAVVVGMALAATIIYRKDMLYPFLAKGSRLWRKQPRIYTNSYLHLIMEDGKKLPLLMQDYSKNGMGLIGSREVLEKYLTPDNQQVELNFEIKAGKTSRQFPAELRNARLVGETVLLGLLIKDDTVVDEFMKRMDSTTRKAAKEVFDRNWTATRLINFTTGVWFVSILSGMGFPMYKTLTGMESDDLANSNAEAPVCVEDDREWLEYHRPSTDDFKALLGNPDGPFVGVDMIVSGDFSTTWSLSGPARQIRALYSPNTGGKKEVNYELVDCFGDTIANAILSTDDNGIEQVADFFFIETDQTIPSAGQFVSDVRAELAAANEDRPCYTTSDQMDRYMSEFCPDIVLHALGKVLDP